METIIIPEIIRKKRNGLELTLEEINIFVGAVVRKNIKDAQTGAMLMAMFLRSLTASETVALTKAMIQNGQVFRVGEEASKNLLVDKHSTGGVGDKVSLILAPALAALGLKVPMMSGWSLDHTGGTLDKLLSIPGFQVSLNYNEMKRCLDEVGCFICSASESFAPADAVLYKLRDATSTVENSGLIVSSILSKKAAEGIGLLVIDVKFGRGSFLQTEEEARNLAKSMEEIGREVNLVVRVVISEMNSPLGQFVGNSLEVVEAVECLNNRLDNDLAELVKLLGAVVLEAAGRADTLVEGKAMMSKCLEDGTALDRFKGMLRAQGVSEKDASNWCTGHVPRADHVTPLRATKSGIITGIDALNIGRACRLLAGGRTTEGGEIDRLAGIQLLKSVGESVKENDEWIRVNHSTGGLTDEVKDMLLSALTVDADSSPSFKKHITMYLYSQKC